MTLDELKARLDSFSPAKIAFVATVVESLSNPSQANIRSQGTWLTGVPEWIEYFGLALSVHHAATTVPLGLTSFEAVFRNACSHVGWPVTPPSSATQRFVDLSVRAGSGRARHLSLKSTAAKGISPTTVHISKLTEAAWIQDTRRPTARRQATLELFAAYQDVVTSILMLRAFRAEDDDQAPQLYQLVEIPGGLFDSIQHEPLSAFQSDAPVIPCRDAGGQIIARVALDRSDAKITVRSIQLDACTVHAEWARA